MTVEIDGVDRSRVKGRLSPPARKARAAKSHQSNSDTGCGFEQDIPIAAFLAAHKPRAKGEGMPGGPCSPGSLRTPGDLRHRVRI
jgi:hypothetical protein